MTNAQKKKLAELKRVHPIYNDFENKSGDLVIDTKYGTKYFQRLFIGPRGGFSSRSIIYAEYDFEDKKPYRKLFEE